MNDLIIGVAKLREMYGTCILVETSGYAVDAKASKTILECLSSIL
jgi:proteasome assembly chaperone (PAC2) family protein